LQKLAVSVLADEGGLMSTAAEGLARIDDLKAEQARERADRENAAWKRCECRYPGDGPCTGSECMNEED
jgi:hypothetical protein